MNERLPFPHRQWEAGTRRRMVQVASIMVLTAALLIALVPGTTTLVVFVLLTLWCHGPLSPLLPAAYEPILLGYGRLFPPLLLAITGAVASTAIEYLNYHLYQKLLRIECIDRILMSPPTRRLMGPFFSRPFLTVWLCVLTPLPDWATRILASHSGYSVRSYLTAVLLARLPRFWFLAALGFHLELGAGAVLSIIAASAVVTLIGLWRRQPTPSSAKAVMPPTVLLLLGVMLAPLPLGRLEGQDPPPRLAGNAMGDLGAAYNLPFPGGSLLLKAGGSAITALGAGGALFVPGFHVGGTVVVQAGDRSGLRIDVIQHYYRPSQEALESTLSVGLGFAVLPRLSS